MYQGNGRSGKNIEYLYLAGSLVAQRETTIASGAVAPKFLHTDALGSPVAVTDAFRNVVETSEYEPYGQLLNRPLKDGPGFTGHVSDAVTGLSYMQQRYYDPQVGRFLSTDPVTAYEKPMTNFNRYVYALNNPYRFNDPDGRNAVTAFGGVLQESWNAINGRGFDGASVWGRAERWLQRRG
jgi:RHS repeat-associated protein